MPTLQLEEDVRDECAEYGAVEGVCIPVPPRTMPPSEPGRAYIMFGSHEEATKAKPVFDGRLFDDGKVTAKLVPDDDFQRAAAGEWIHTPMPGGLPAHPGNASARASLSHRLTWSVTGVTRQKATCVEESRVCTISYASCKKGSMNKSCKPNIACKEMVSALHSDFVSLLALTWAV